MLTRPFKVKDHSQAKEGQGLQQEGQEFGLRSMLKITG